MTIKSDKETLKAPDCAEFVTELDISKMELYSQSYVIDGGYL